MYMNKGEYVYDKYKMSKPSESLGLGYYAGRDHVYDEDKIPCRFDTVLPGNPNRTIINEEENMYGTTSISVL